AVIIFFYALLNACYPKFQNQFFLFNGYLKTISMMNIIEKVSKDVNQIIDDLEEIENGIRKFYNEEEKLDEIIYLWRSNLYHKQQSVYHNIILLFTDPEYKIYHNEIDNNIISLALTLPGHIRKA